MSLEKMFTRSKLHWKFNHSSIKQPNRGSLKGSLLFGPGGYATPLQLQLSTGQWRSAN